MWLLGDLHTPRCKKMDEDMWDPFEEEEEEDFVVE